MIPWDDQLSVGVAQLDEHHAQLVKIVNEIEYEREVGGDYQLLKKLLFELISYTKYHFSAEERFMIKYHYPDIESHSEEHRLLTQQVELFLEQYTAHDDVLIVEVHEFLKRWLVEHTLNSDRRLGAFLNQQGVH